MHPTREVQSSVPAALGPPKPFDSPPHTDLAPCKPVITRQRCAVHPYKHTCNNDSLTSPQTYQIYDWCYGHENSCDAVNRGRRRRRNHTTGWGHSSNQQRWSQTYRNHRSRWLQNSTPAASALPKPFDSPPHTDLTPRRPVITRQRSALARSCC